MKNNGDDDNNNDGDDQHEQRRAGKRSSKQHRNRDRGGGRGRGGNSSNSKGGSKNANISTAYRASILVLHGNRQTGELLLGRMSNFEKKLRRTDLMPFGRPMKLMAIDAPFSFKNADITVDDHHHHQEEEEEDADKELKTWWHRKGNLYEGLEQTLKLVRDTWDNPDGTDSVSFEGILGFSQGARLAHLVAILHSTSKATLFPNLRYIIFVGGYGDVPLPSNFPPPSFQPHLLHQYQQQQQQHDKIYLPTLHVMGENDALVTLPKSEALLKFYINPQIHRHVGGHFVPVKAHDVQLYINFIQSVFLTNDEDLTTSSSNTPHLSQQQQQQQQQHSIPHHHGAAQQNLDLKPSSLPSNFNNTPPQSQPQSNTPSGNLPANDIVVAANELGQPDEDHARTQCDEVESLSLIYPDQFRLLSNLLLPDDSDNFEQLDTIEKYAHPISYEIRLHPSTENDDFIDEATLPPKPLSLRIQYPSNYPDVPPLLTLAHQMNLLEMGTGQERAILTVLRNAASDEEGMPCIMGCVHAAKDFLASGGWAQAASAVDNAEERKQETTPDSIQETAQEMGASVSKHDDGTPLPKPASSDRIRECNLNGLEIARSILGRFTPETNVPNEQTPLASSAGVTNEPNSDVFGKGGSWHYVIGLVGKPSAGKSTFFNAATAFARQRGSGEATSSSSDASPDQLIGGATMAPHPFTTIDPNIGYCLVPAPTGSCPENDEGDDGNCIADNKFEAGSTHGRDSDGRRLIPVMLKDVAGLVPGAYTGRGRGNKFLDDLTDADVLIHVVDASGTADAEGNAVGYDDISSPQNNTSEASSINTGTHPLDDLAWVQNELVEWVYFNLANKWSNIVRRGRTKLADMFSGYKQNQAFVWRVLLSVEKHMYEKEGRDRALDHLHLWDEGDVHLLVSAFLGARFPMALALNKSDLPSAIRYVRDVQEALPIHGSHVGVPMSARAEMKFVRRHILGYATKEDKKVDDEGKMTAKNMASEEAIPKNVWNCLQSSICLREPVLVFPVGDMTTYEPIKAMTGYAIGDASLPSPAMISCLRGAGGTIPSLYDEERGVYSPTQTQNIKQTNQPLRDVVVMKPGSTVEDVFFVLKRLGALGGEFVRAEGAGYIGEKAKLVKKDDLVCKSNRILKIMTNKRKEWQKTLHN